MAEIKEEVIVDVKINEADTETRVTQLTKRIAELRADSDKLSESNKKLTRFGKENTAAYLENSKGIEINKQLIREATAERNNLIASMLSEDKSIKALQIRNKELIKQRNEISTATEEGRAKIALLNKEIDANNAVIQANSSQLEQQKINIGNYASALDSVAPGINAYIQGTKQMITVSRAFISTPIGAVIGALGLALGALIAYFKGSEEGQDRWNKIVQVGSALLGKFMDFVRDIGEAIANTFSVDTVKRFADFIKNDLIGIVITNLTNRFKALGVIWEGLVNFDFKQVANGVLQMATGVEDVIGKTGNMIDTIKEGAQDAIKSIMDTANEAVRQGNRVADLERAIRLREREDMLLNAKTAIEVAKLREKASYEEGEQRRKTMEEAIRLQEHINDREVELAQMRLDLAQQQADIADNDIEANNALAKAKEAVLRAELKRYTDSLRLHRQLAAAIEEEQAELERLEKEREKAAERALKAEHSLALTRAQNRVAFAKSIQERVQLEIDAEMLRREQLLSNQNLLEDERQLIIEQSEAKIREIRAKGAEDEKKQREKELREYQRIERMKVEATTGGLALITKEKSQARVIGNAIFKQDAIKETYTNTYTAAQAAYKAMVGIPVVGPVLAPIAAGIATAFGLAQVANIVGIQFANGGLVPGYARGGLSGTKIMNHHGIPISRPNGDNRLATVRTGEVILNERQQAALGGARTFRAIGVPGFAGGGFTGGIAGLSATSAADSRARQVAQDMRIEKALREVRTVLVLQDFEAASEAKNSPIERAQVI